jgi:hypothetical protein
MRLERNEACLLLVQRPCSVGLLIWPPAQGGFWRTKNSPPTCPGPPCLPQPRPPPFRPPPAEGMRMKSGLIQAAGRIENPICNPATPPAGLRHTNACVWPLPLRRAATQDTATPRHREAPGTRHRDPAVRVAAMPRAYIQRWRRGTRCFPRTGAAPRTYGKARQAEAALAVF